MNDEKMLCPFCKKELKQGEKKKYETLYEHVLDPNEEEYERPLRPTFVCDCEMAKDSFWDDYGDFYSHNREQDYTNIEYEALNSASRKSNQEFKERERKRRKWWHKLYMKIVRLRHKLFR